MQVDPEQVRQVSIASPCTARWDEMKGDELVRHCEHCRKDVYNLSSLSLEEVAHLIASKEGRMCVRFYRRADGTLLTDDCPRGLAAVRRRMAVVAGLVPMPVK